MFLNDCSRIRDFENGVKTVGPFPRKNSNRVLPTSLALMLRLGKTRHIASFAESCLGAFLSRCCEPGVQ